MEITARPLEGPAVDPTSPVPLDEGEIEGNPKNDGQAAPCTVPTTYMLGLSETGTDQSEKTSPGSTTGWISGPVGEAGVAAVGKAVQNGSSTLHCRHLMWDSFTVAQVANGKGT